MRVRRAAHAECAGAPRLAAGHALGEIARFPVVETVAAYLPIRAELDPEPAMRALSSLGYRVAVPVIEASESPLVFHAWLPGGAVERGRFGVLVPVGGEIVEPDVLIVPMLAFDRRGHRLGYGGGFYDRTIAALRSRREIRALGFAYSAQEVPLVPDEETDMQLDAIVTERGILRPT